MWTGSGYQKLKTESNKQKVESERELDEWRVLRHMLQPM
jgi:hypothetical protein